MNNERLFGTQEEWLDDIVKLKKENPDAEISFWIEGSDDKKIRGLLLQQRIRYVYLDNLLEYNRKTYFYSLLEDDLDLTDEDCERLKSLPGWKNTIVVFLEDCLIDENRG